MSFMADWRRGEVVLRSLFVKVLTKPEGQPVYYFNLSEKVFCQILLAREKKKQIITDISNK